MIHNKATFVIAVGALAGSFYQPANAQAYRKEQESDASSFEEIWSLAKLYQDDQNPWLQEFKLRGRYHGQYHDVHADSGESHGWEDRRARLGFDAKLFDKKLEARFDFQSNNGFVDGYDGLVDAYLKWKPRKEITVVAGKTKPLIGAYDWLSSSNDTPTFERSQIFNQLGINRATGFTVEGIFHTYTWQAGVYSNSTPSNTNGTGNWGDGEWGDLDAGVSYTLGIGYEIDGLSHGQKASIRLDWLHSEREERDLVLSRYDDIFSATLLWSKDAWNVVAEAYAARGGDGLNDDVYGIFLQPTYDLVANQLQLVARYSYTHGEGDASVVAQSRYEREVGIDAIPGIPSSGNRGDEYHSVYLGTQYFIYGNQWKWQAGVEWSQLLRDGNSTGYEGVSALTGMRISF
jgi:phosphate-selective porin OprO/OprP